MYDAQAFGALQEFLENVPGDAIFFGIGFIALCAFGIMILRRVIIRS